MSLGFLSLVGSLTVLIVTCGDGEHVSQTGIITGGIFLAFCEEVDEEEEEE